jgi:hypothetical protein
LSYARRVSWLRLLVLLFAFAHATGLPDVVEVACDDSCEEGEAGCEEGCPPICVSCHCARCPVASAPPSAAMDPLRRAADRLMFAESERMPASRHVDEILRVPIARA